MDEAAAPSSLLAEGEILEDKYRIGRFLGAGGMAAVFSATHLVLDETVAIKTLRPECEGDPAIVQRFIQEGKAAIKIRSEHVVRMHDVCFASGHTYLVMEYLAGKDLEALVRTEGPLPPHVAVDLLLQACEAIGVAHALGIVHRDLKPANLFLTHRADGSPCVKVLDFGISKLPTSIQGPSPVTQTLASTIMGSPQYMAPEQMLSAATADQRSDLWSLGAVLYELLSGKLAFTGTTASEICARVLQGTYIPLEQLRPDLPAGLAAAVKRCLERDPAARFANVAALACALAPFGTKGARASAESVARVLDHSEAFGATLPPSLAAGTLKPTAAEILAAPPPPSPKRFGLFAVASILAVVVLGFVGARNFAPLSPLYAAAAGAPAPSLSAPLPNAEPAPPEPPAGPSTKVPTAVVAPAPSSSTAVHPAARAGLTKPRASSEDAPARRFTAIPPTVPTVDDKDGNPYESAP